MVEADLRFSIDTCLRGVLKIIFHQVSFSKTVKIARVQKTSVIRKVSTHITDDFLPLAGWQASFVAIT